MLQNFRANVLKGSAEARVTSSRVGATSFPGYLFFSSPLSPMNDKGGREEIQVGVGNLAKFIFVSS